ncbi:MAG: DUF1365 domain-containing protein [Deltaproteobacteria bacterium]|nr:DUF1365 domain-containing protein [Deltaproteobacteria bacterium]
MHARSDEHARRTFRYPVYVASLDLDELDALDRELRLFSHGGRNLFALHDADYAETLSPSRRVPPQPPRRVPQQPPGERHELRRDQAPAPAPGSAPAPAGRPEFDTNRDSNRHSYQFARPATCGGAELTGLPPAGPSRPPGPETRTNRGSNGHSYEFASPPTTVVAGASAGNRMLRESLDALHDGAGLARPHRVRLVTNLRTLGYVFNPVSFFLGHDAAGELATVVAEVNNTYGGRLRYLLGPRDRLPDRDGRIGFRHVRELFVSPFLHGEATYDFWFDRAIDPPALSIAMHVWQGDRRVFVARLEGARAPLTDRTLAWAALRYPMMSAQVIGLIHWQALRLRLAGVAYRRPRGDHRPLVVRSP